MALFYLDIETNSLDPRKGQIITIQYQCLERRSEPLVILRAWEHPDGERGIVREFCERTAFFRRKWEFQPVGWNVVGMEFKWLHHKAKQFGVLDAFHQFEKWEKPHIDLQHLARMILGGEIRGSSLANFSRKVKKTDGIPTLFERGDYDSIIDYVLVETKSFLELWDALIEHMPAFYDNVIAPQAGGLTSQLILAENEK